MKEFAAVNNKIEESEKKKSEDIDKGSNDQKRQCYTADLEQLRKDEEQLRKKKITTEKGKRPGEKGKRTAPSKRVIVATRV